MQVNEEKEMTIEEFFKLASEGGTYQIDTPDGWQNIGFLIEKKNRECYNLVLQDGKELGCSAEHLVLTDEGWKSAEKINVQSDCVFTENGKKQIVAKEYIGVRSTFDLGVNSDQHRYYSNGIISHNCGKSLSAKAVASLFEMPLIRLDMGAMFGSRVGESVSGDEDVILFHGKKKKMWKGKISDAYLKFGEYPSELSTITWDDNFKVKTSLVDKIIKHTANNRVLKKISTSRGYEITVTQDHGLFKLNNKSELEEVLTSELKLGDFVAVSNNIKYPCFKINHIDLLKIIPVDEYKNWSVENIFDILDFKKMNSFDKKNFFKGIFDSGKNGFRTLDGYYRFCKKYNMKISGDLVLKPKGYPRKSPGIKRYLKVDDKLMFTFGLWMGDGSNSKKQYNFRIAGHVRDAEYISKNIYFPCRIYKSKSNGIDIQASSMWNKIRIFLGLEGDDLVRRIPSWIMQLDSNSISSFVRGYFFADGHTTKNEKSFEVSSVSEKLIDDVCILLKRLSIYYSVSKKKNMCGNTEYRISIKQESSRDLLNDIMNAKYKKKKNYMCKSIYITDAVRGELNKIEKECYKKGYQGFRKYSFRYRFKHSHKKTTASFLFKVLNKIKRDISEYPSLSKQINGDIQFEKIVKIEDVKQHNESVYDLSVPGTNKFICGFNGLIVHNSEQRMRTALQCIESISPVLCWIDEADKAISGSASSAHTDGGTTARVVSTLLTWMQEKTKPVFVIATANSITNIPPEFMRAGRFDEVFFLDLPNLEERADIAGKLLRRKKRDENEFDLYKIAKCCENFVGAEIEKAIDNSLFLCYYEDKRKLTTEDICSAFKQFVPLYQSRKEEIQSMRTWAKEGGAVIANSSPESKIKKPVKIKNGNTLDMDKDEEILI